LFAKHAEIDGQISSTLVMAQLWTHPRRAGDGRASSIVELTAAAGRRRSRLPGACAGPQRRPPGAHLPPRRYRGSL